MDVAEGQHHIGRRGLAQHRRGRIEGDYRGAVELRRRPGELLRQAIARTLLVVTPATGRQRLWIHHRRHVLAILTQIGRQDLRIPAAAGRDLHHRLCRLQAEERQRLRRVAMRIANDIGRGAPAAGHRRLQLRCNLEVGSAGRGLRGNSRCAREQHTHSQQTGTQQRYGLAHRGLRLFMWMDGREPSTRHSGDEDVGYPACTSCARACRKAPPRRSNGT